MSEVADRLFAAIEAGDLDTVRALYAPDAVIWHNNDGTEQTVEQNLRVLRWMVDHLADRRYEEIRAPPPRPASCSSTSCAAPAPTAPGWTCPPAGGDLCRRADHAPRGVP